MAIVDNAFREWIADFKAANPSAADSRAILDTAQYAFAAGRKAQREIDAAPPAKAVDLGQFQEVVSAVNTRLQSVIGDNMMPWSERDKASKEQAALYPLLALIDSQAVGK